MSDITQIDATMRSRVGKGSARAARRAGKIPAVIYGDKQAPLSIEMEARVVRKVIHEPGIFGRLLNINIDGKDNTVLTRDIQMHPVSDEPLHMDMLRVGASSTVSVAVPVEFINHELSPGLKIGGVLNVVRFEVELNCPAGDIPEKITVDLDGIKIGDLFTLAPFRYQKGQPLQLRTVTLPWRPCSHQVAGSRTKMKKKAAKKKQLLLKAKQKNNPCGLSLHNRAVRSTFPASPF